MVPRSYYSSSIRVFLDKPADSILGNLIKNNQFNLEEQQRNAWISEITILKNSLKNLTSGNVLFEYSIPRMGRRSDVILLLRGLVFVLEFKINESFYRASDIDQCLDYALDLKYFHEQSQHRKIIPILIATSSMDVKNDIEVYQDGVFIPQKCNKTNLNKLILRLSQEFGDAYMDPIKWENSIYKPTPTIIEAAQALYEKHDVREISRSDAGAENLTRTAEAINKIVEKSKKEKMKSICFVTGVPGSGKTLAGLNIANDRHKISEEEHAVFLSGNGPLVKVLQEALARNRVANSLGRISKFDALRESSAFIQNIHHFRDNGLEDLRPPIEKVVVFDEAQRAWNQKQTASFMLQKKAIERFNQSESEFLISVMDRHKDWCVIVCLVGGGQEINRGEGGLLEWFSSIKNHFKHWQVYVPQEISDIEYTRGVDLQNIVSEMKSEYVQNLHLKTSIRSFRSENVAKFVKALLDRDTNTTSKLLLELNNRYPIVITRSIFKAKEWLKQNTRGNERIGLIASSNGQRLKPYGIFVELKIDPAHWFLNSKTDIRSSHFLEYVATEFDIQGLELDWICVGWDADFRLLKQEWTYNKFSGRNWQQIRNKESMQYLKNTYRVLLTRARQGLVIFVPEGNEDDLTASPSFYNETYEYLRNIGLKEIP